MNEEIESIIRDLNNQENQRIYCARVDFISEHIQEVSKCPLFYKLPLEIISTIIQKSYFNEEHQDSEVFKNIIAGIVSYHKQDSISLLNYFSNEQYPNFTEKQITSLISNFRDSEIIERLSFLSNEEMKQVECSENEINQLQSKLKTVQETNKVLKEKLNDFQPKDSFQKEFLPVRKEPFFFEPNIFKAIQTNKLRSLQYRVEAQGFDIRSNFQCYKAYNKGKCILSEERRNIPTGSYNIHPVSLSFLHISCYYGRLAISQYLIEIQHLDKDATDEDGKTAVHFAC